MNITYRKNMLRSLARSARIAVFRKIAVELMQIKKSPIENKIFNLLLDVVKEKAPDTILRVEGGWNLLPK